MYEEIEANLKTQLSREEFNRLNMKTSHLAIMVNPYLDYILEGRKTIESRFTKNKILPYGRISSGDTVLLKRSGGPIVGYFTVGEVMFYDLQIDSIEEIKTKYSKELCVDDSFWDIKKDSNYATLIKIDNLKKVKPFSIAKKGMQTWITFKKD